MSSASADKLSPTPPPDIAARLASLEGRLAGSWASYTRDEYEKNLREGIKQDIMSYVSKVAIGLLLFLGEREPSSSGTPRRPVTRRQTDKSCRICTRSTQRRSRRTGAG
jgi:hypothetical protein